MSAAAQFVRSVKRRRNFLNERKRKSSEFCGRATAPSPDVSARAPAVWVGMAATSGSCRAWPTMRSRAARACVFACLLVLTNYCVRTEAAPNFDRQNLNTFDGHHLMVPMTHRGGFSVTAARERDHHRRQRALLQEGDDDSDFATLPLHGSVKEHGYYYVDLRLGTPPKQFQVIVDTGSTLTYVPCSDCGSQCGGHTGAPPFNVEDSTTSEKVNCGTEDCHEGGCAGSDSQNSQCVYQKSYAEGSAVRGRLVKDVVNLGGGYGDKAVVFGCTTKETGGIHAQVADGLMVRIAFPKSRHLRLPNKTDTFLLRSRASGTGRIRSSTSSRNATDCATRFRCAMAASTAAARCPLARFLRIVLTQIVLTQINKTRR